jgi:hypothetical protein
MLPDLEPLSSDPLFNFHVHRVTSTFTLSLVTYYELGTLTTLDYNRSNNNIITIDTVVIRLTLYYTQSNDINPNNYPKKYRIVVFGRVRY